MPATSFTSGDPQRIPSALDLVRPGGPPARVITPLEIYVLAFGAERGWREVLGNYPARVEHIGGQAMIGGVGAANVVDLGRDLVQVAPFVVDELGRIDFKTMSVRMRMRAARGVDGAGPRIVDLRGTQPTEAELAEIAADPEVVGIFLSHTDPEDANRPSWRVLLKSPQVIRMRRKRKVSLRLRKHRLTEDDLQAGREPRTYRDLTTILIVAVKLMSPFSSLATAAARIVRGDS
jgi:hypothetical protein